MMRHRFTLVGAAMGLFAYVAIASTPAMATPCTNLQSLQIQDTTITSATDNTRGTFVVPGSNPPATITGLPAFCRVTANLVPSSDSNIKIEVWLPESGWNGRFLGTGGGGFQGVITYNELALGIQYPSVVLVSLGCAIARHQVGGGLAERLSRLDAEDAGHVTVHQHIAEIAVLDVDDRGHGVDDLLQEPAAFGDRIFRALLVGDVAHRAFVARHLAAIVTHHGRAVGQPADVAALLAHLVFEFAHHAVTLHQALELLTRDPKLRAKEHQELRVALRAQIGDTLELAQIG